MLWLVVIVSVLTCGPLASFIAHSRGGDGAIGFLIGAIFGPLGVIAAFAMGNTQALEKRAVAEGGSKVCPMCAETVKSAAVICRFCTHTFEANQPSPEAPAITATPPIKGEEADNAVYVILGFVAIFVLAIIIKASMG